ncbi:MAG: ATP-binding cassette subfamily F protein 3 [Phenylobacterium sp.]|jgi:ATP-binding cassette subfamily F protein 3
MSALLQLIDISYSHSHETLFEGLNLTINQHDKIGLVGHNGTGKSTLLSLIKGDKSLDAGEIRKPNAVKVGIVEQFVDKTLQTATLIDAVIAVIPEDDRLSNSWQAESQLMTLGFSAEQFSLPVAGLSGGQQNLLLIARALVQQPDVLLMDEPGNHMDISALARLEQFLALECQCPFLIISHDQYLLDNVCKKTVFLRDKRTYEFDLPFEQAFERLVEEDRVAQNRRALEEKEIKRLQATAKRLAIWGQQHDNEKFVRRAKSMEKRIVKLDQSKTEVSKGSPLNLTLKNHSLGAKQVMAMENCAIRTPDQVRLLLDIELLVIRPGDRIALLGINGVGKSSTLETIRKACASEEPPAANIRFNPRAELGYYDQGLVTLDQDLTRLDWLRQYTPANEDSLKHSLINAGVSYQDFDRRVNSLSGGEKARMMFMAFALNQPNFMILDEPTNHIDLEGKKQLTEQLMSSGATLLITSHDRHFLDKIATRWLWIDQGKLVEVTSGDDFYQSLIGAGMSADKMKTVATDRSDDSSAVDTAEPMTDEDQLLARADELETKLTADLARKAKFQKAHLHAQWQQELEEIWAQLG